MCGWLFHNLLVGQENETHSDNESVHDDAGHLSDYAGRLMSKTLPTALEQPISLVIFWADQRMEIPENVSHQVKKLS